MLSFNKLLLLALVVFGVWYGFKWLRRVEEMRRMHARDDERGGRGSGERPQVRAEDMVQCRRCGTYVPGTGAAACGRSDCPYG